MSSVDLTVANSLSSSTEQVKDQNDNGSELYLSTDAVAIGRATPDSGTLLTVYAPAGKVPVTSHRPGITNGATRTHWKAQSTASSGSTTEVWRLMTGDDDTYGFILRVNGTDRLIIDQFGNMTLNVASLKITGLPSGAPGTDLVIDGNGYVGQQ